MEKLDYWSFRTRSQCTNANFLILLFALELQGNASESTCAMIFKSDGGIRSTAALHMFQGRKGLCTCNFSENVRLSQNLKFNEIEQCRFFFLKKKKRIKNVCMKSEQLCRNILQNGKSSHMSTQYAQDVELSSLYILSHLNFTPVLQSGYYQYHFTDEESEAQRD